VKFQNKSLQLSIFFNLSQSVKFKKYGSKSYVQSDDCSECFESTVESGFCTVGLGCSGPGKKQLFFKVWIKSCVNCNDKI
jgi:hypothetical protein